MSDLEYGPVEFLLVAFDGEQPDPGVVGAIRELVDSGQVRVVDALLISRDENGDLTEVEIDNAAEVYGLDEADLDLAGLAAEEDVAALGEQLEPGTSAALLVVEMLWAKKFASALAASGGAVVAAERIPAPLVNDLVQTLRQLEADNGEPILENN